MLISYEVGHFYLFSSDEKTNNLSFFTLIQNTLVNLIKKRKIQQA